MELYIKGIIIGVGKILPGISGSMLAIMLGEYEKIIESITNLKEQFKERKTYLLKLGLGIITAITLLSKVIVKCLNTHYLTTMLLLTGMIAGNIIKRVKQINTTVEKKYILTLVASTIIIQAIITKLKLNLLPQQSTKKIQYTLSEFITLTGIGSIDAISSIIPGISGTALLMMTGYYEIIIRTLSTLLDYKKILINGFVIIPFFIGFIITLIIMAKILNILLARYKRRLDMIVISFMTLTIATLIKTTIKSNRTMIEYIIGIVSLAIGIIIPNLVNIRKKVN